MALLVSPSFLLFEADAPNKRPCTLVAGGNLYERASADAESVEGVKC